MPDSVFSYYKINTVLRRWSQKDGARVVREARLSMDKAPPKLSESTQGNFAFPEYFPPKKSAGEVFDDLEKIGGAFKRFKKWLDTPDPPKPAKASHAPKPETVPPFD